MASLSQKNNSWQLSWYSQGKRYRKSLGKVSASQAEAMRQRKEAELAAGITEGYLRKSHVLFDEVVDDYFLYIQTEKPASWETTWYTAKHLYAVFGKMCIADITARLIDAHIQARIQEGAKTSSINRELTTLAAILNRAMRMGSLDRAIPIKKLQIIDSKPPAYYTAEQLKAIYEHSNGSAHWWQLIVNTGMRSAEAYHLRWEHIRDGSIYIISEEGARTKSGRYRQIPINESISRALESFTKEKYGYVYPRIRLDAIKRKFRRICERASISPAGIHTLRHTFCSHLVMQGVDLRTIQVLAGHASITTTERYAHLSQDHLKKALTKMRL